MFFHHGSSQWGDWNGDARAVDHRRSHSGASCSSCGSVLTATASTWAALRSSGAESRAGELVVSIEVPIDHAFDRKPFAGGGTARVGVEGVAGSDRIGHLV